MFWNVFAGLVIGLIILYGVNIFLAAGILGPVKEGAEKNRPANLELTFISSECESCNAMGGILPFIKGQGVKITRETNLTTGEGAALISKYGIRTLPALIVTGEVSKENVQNIWTSLDAKQSQGAMIISGIPPYFDIGEQKVKGAVELLILRDEDCEGCYNPLLHLTVLRQFGVFVENAAEYNVSSGIGASVIAKYNITKVPTIVFSPDASLYQALNQVWPSVGTVESDGWYVFRAVEVMGTYKDLVNNTVVNATR